MELKAFQLLEFINNRLSNIEKNISKLDEKLDFAISLSRNHLIRIKNGEAIDDSMILMGRPYNDLSPAKAFEIYSNPNMDFMILDVSVAGSKNTPIPGSILIPLEELDRRWAEIKSRTLPILILCENGIRSIKAAELLVRKGFFNINTVSGGHEFWPGRERRSAPPPSP